MDTENTTLAVLVISRPSHDPANTRFGGNVAEQAHYMEVTYEAYHRQKHVGCGCKLLFKRFLLDHIFSPASLHDEDLQPVFEELIEMRTKIQSAPPGKFQYVILASGISDFTVDIDHFFEIFSSMPEGFFCTFDFDAENTAGISSYSTKQICSEHQKSLNREQHTDALALFAVWDEINSIEDQYVLLLQVSLSLLINLQKGSFRSTSQRAAYDGWFWYP